MSAVDFSALDAKPGSICSAVFDLAALPAEMRVQLDPAHRYRQLILIGHGGRALWERVEAAGLRSEHPIDDFTHGDGQARGLPRSCRGCCPWVGLPRDGPVGLQALGRLAGWHHDSPFRVGVNAANGVRGLRIARSCWWIPSCLLTAPR
jgi:epoxyqueuosine reductase